MTVDGYLTHRIFQGAIDTELMLEFLQEDVLPRWDRAIGRCNVKILLRYMDLSYLRSFTDVGCGWHSINANKSDVVI